MKNPKKDLRPRAFIPEISNFQWMFPIEYKISSKIVFRLVIRALADIRSPNRLESIQSFRISNLDFKSYEFFSAPILPITFLRDVDGLKDSYSENSLKIRYLGDEDMRAHLLFRFFLPHRDVHIAKTWGLNGLNTGGGGFLVSTQPPDLSMHKIISKVKLELLNTFLSREHASDR
jgi:hypothetical protein